MSTVPNLLNDDETASIATALMMSHHGFRRDLARFESALEKVAQGESSRVEALRDEWQSFHATLHGHHLSEDTGVLPNLAAEHPSVRGVVEQLSADHRRIDPLLERGQAAFAALPNATEALAVIRELSALLAPHLATEEREIIPFLRGAQGVPAASERRSCGDVRAGFRLGHARRRSRRAREGARDVAGGPARASARGARCVRRSLRARLGLGPGRGHAHADSGVNTWCALGILVLAAACTPPSSPLAGPAHDTQRSPETAALAVVADAPDAPDAPPSPAPPDARPAPDAPTSPAQLDPDGNDDRGPPGAGTVPPHAHFERVGRTWASLTRICDFVPFQGSLFAAHAIEPLGVDGATLTRYTRPTSTPTPTPTSTPTPTPTPTLTPSPSPFSIAFDWNRPGEPKKGGGSGQGFTRIRSLGGRLFVPDSDPPYNGFGLLDRGTEGYVFVSDAQGHFARAAGEHFRPPAFPTAERAGAGVVPRAYHDLDVIRFRGATYVSTGSVPPGERAWSGPSPGALHVASEDFSRWTYVVGYPKDATRDVWRLTFLVRFRDRVYAGIQEYSPREPNDYVVLEPPRDSTAITAADLRAVKATPLGGTQTLRWYADQGSLYWIGIDRDGAGVLRVTRDGDTWREVALPDHAGRPSDIVRFRDALVVLTENGLYRLEPTSAAVAPAAIATWSDPKLFRVDDSSAPRRSPSTRTTSTPAPRRTALSGASSSRRESRQAAKTPREKFQNPWRLGGLAALSQRPGSSA